MSDKEKAHHYVENHGRTVSRTPGGNERMGFRQVGPKENTIASKAQSYQGDVRKGTTFAEIQRGAMKKK